MTKYPKKALIKNGLVLILCDERNLPKLESIEGKFKKVNLES